MFFLCEYYVERYIYEEDDAYNKRQFGMKPKRPRISSLGGTCLQNVSSV